MLAAACHPEFFEYSDQEAFVIYVEHVSFQLYHCSFPKEYLREVYDTGEVKTSRVTLNKTRSYDFCNVNDRGEWLKVFVALLLYLVSGESKVGYLNMNHEKNLLHKVSHDIFHC